MIPGINQLHLFSKSTHDHYNLRVFFIRLFLIKYRQIINWIIRKFKTNTPYVDSLKT